MEGEGIRPEAFIPGKLTGLAGKNAGARSRTFRQVGLGFLLGRTPLKRVTLTNLNSLESLKAQFNPNQYREQLAVNYERNDIRGLPHQPLDYNNTSNHQIFMDFYADSGMQVGAVPIASIFNRPKIDEFKNFLMALCYPPAQGSGVIANAGPPRCLLNWPNALVMHVAVTSLSFNNQRFDWKDSSITAYVARVSFEEVRDQRLTSEEVRSSGTVRPGIEAPSQSFLRNLLGSRAL